MSAGDGDVETIMVPATGLDEHEPRGTEQVYG
jgi:hypothetical protein